MGRVVLYCFLGPTTTGRCRRCCPTSRVTRLRKAEHRLSRASTKHAANGERLGARARGGDSKCGAENESD